MRKNFIAKIGIVAMFLNFFGGYSQAFAATPASVVINEVAWAGSANSGNDEWIELYNNTGVSVDLTGWVIKDDGVASYQLNSGSIPAHGYFLIENAENAVNNVQSDAIINLSLANTGDSLQLVDNANNIIDAVNGSGGMWYAGAAASTATMERKDPNVGDIASNFGTSTGGGGALASAGGMIIGTPKATNSVVSAAVIQNNKVNLAFSNDKPVLDEQITVTAQATNVQNLFAYGLELNYDAAVLDFVSATKKGFLSQNGTVNTSFQSGLKNGQAGDLLVAEAKTQDQQTGVNGNGDLFELKFKVKVATGNVSQISFVNANSFMSSLGGDLQSQFVAGSFTPAQNISVNPISNLQISEGTTRYSLKLDWTASPSNPEKYKIERKNAHGNWIEIGQTAAIQFIDNDTVVNAGKLIPHVNYFYKVTAMKNNVISTSVEGQGMESRGLKGDNTRSDLVDGRDLESLAQHFAEDDTNPNFNALIDTTYDGIIDGSDLIDIGANFAKAY